MKVNAMKNLMVVIIATSLAACSTMSNKVSLIGMSKLDLYECAGIPTRKDGVEGVEFLTYTNHGEEQAKIQRYGEVGFKRSSCSTTFTIKDGKISNYKYNSQRGSGGYFAGRLLCSNIMRDCSLVR